LLARRGGITERIKERPSICGSFASAKKILNSFSVAYCEYLSDYNVLEIHITYEMKVAFTILYAEIFVNILHHNHHHHLPPPSGSGGGTAGGRKGVPRMAYAATTICNVLY
jgi:hypothetical protein